MVCDTRSGLSVNMPFRVSAVRSHMSSMCIGSQYPRRLEYIMSPYADEPSRPYVPHTNTTQSHSRDSAELVRSPYCPWYVSYSLRCRAVLVRESPGIPQTLDKDNAQDTSQRPPFALRAYSSLLPCLRRRSHNDVRASSHPWSTSVTRSTRAHTTQTQTIIPRDPLRSGTYW